VIRPDRLATLYFFHPLRRLLRRAPAGIPILMYHSISENPESHKNPYYHTCTSPRVFRQHLNFLARNGYRTIGLGEAVRKLQEGAQTAEKLVVLTFNDGFEDFYTEAFPALSASGYAATVFLPTAYIGDSPREFNGIACLTWSQVRELRKAGVEFGSHTLTHPQLRELLPAGVDRQLRSSKEEIEDRLGAPVASFSYPYAFPEPDRAFRQMLRDMLMQAGYENGVSTIVGTADSSSDRLFLERIPANSSDDESLFTAKLQGGYDWLHGVQYGFKLRDGSLKLRYESGTAGN
jgi:peptidoglycan/xylan/chitin deacetylase (PgdA/CDA1 family)